ncbi:MAG: S1 RNA-binding domain-containing protein [Lachnospiraceae bacterium]|nr:S1 RNA-binding domain-containing protein [Lachnospiraceae bacterium]
MFKLGQTQTLTVTRKTEHGIYLKDPSENTYENGISESDEVLLPSKEVPSGTKPGDILNVFIYRDSSDRLTATLKTPAISLNETAVLRIRDVGKIGAFADWGLEKDLLLPYAEMTKKPVPNEEILAALYIDKSSRLCLTMKVYPYLSGSSPYKKDDMVSGRIYEINKEIGAFVAVDDRYFGLIPKNEIFSEIAVNTIINARVTRVREDGKLDLSLRKKAYKQMDEDAEKVLDIIESYDGVLPFNDRAGSEIIKRETGMSKNEFKRAVGRLYKERRIIITDTSIRLSEGNTSDD